eukprot:GEMP01070833.1.p1 GENE.GEMP01070833.1~~GEMP01070833.1.p1  ORF type:complete len:378 (+),score=42.68 GEMP01070833.1:44-1177(+)
MFSFQNLNFPPGISGVPEIGKRRVKAPSIGSGARFRRSTFNISTKPIGMPFVFGDVIRPACAERPPAVKRSTISRRQPRARASTINISSSIKAHPNTKAPQWPRPLQLQVPRLNLTAFRAMVSAFQQRLHWNAMIPITFFAPLRAHPNSKLGSFATARPLWLYGRASTVTIGVAVKNVTSAARVGPTGNVRYLSSVVLARTPAVMSAETHDVMSAETHDVVPAGTPAVVPAETPDVVPAGTLDVVPNETPAMVRVIVAGIPPAALSAVSSNEDVPTSVQAPVQSKSACTQQITSSQPDCKSDAADAADASMEEPEWSSQTIAGPPSSYGSYRLPRTSVDTTRLQQKRESYNFYRYIKAFIFLLLICAHFFISTLSAR